MNLPSEIAGRWESGVVLKRDVFSTVERGIFLADGNRTEAVLRRIDQVPWWSVPLARLLFRRERRALVVAGPLGIAPALLFAGHRTLVRGWIEGVSLHIARPTGDRRYFLSAKAALRKLHRAGICHNDLAKEQNWLRGADGLAYLTDFQLASRFSRRSRMFRVAAYEDLRHLLKHKRRYVPEALTPAELRVLARKSAFTRIWMATGKKVYQFATRDLLGFTDREGGGPRLVYDAPRIAARLKALPQVSEVVIVAYPERRTGTGLYAFVEGTAELSEQSLRAALTGPGEPRPPEHLQIAAALPRRASGEVRNEILQLIAMNQVDSIAPLIASDEERAVVERLIAGRRNFRDRFSY
jgi:hypothetical protein